MNVFRLILLGRIILLLLVLFFSPSAASSPYLVFFACFYFNLSAPIQNRSYQAYGMVAATLSMCMISCRICWQFTSLSVQEDVSVPYYLPRSVVFWEPVFSTKTGSRGFCSMLGFFLTFFFPSFQLPSFLSEWEEASQPFDLNSLIQQLFYANTHHSPPNLVYLGRDECTVTSAHSQRKKSTAVSVSALAASADFDFCAVHGLQIFISCFLSPAKVFF